MNYIKLILTIRPLLQWIVKNISKGLDKLQELEDIYEGEHKDEAYFKFCIELDRAFLANNMGDIKRILRELNMHLNKF